MTDFDNLSWILDSVIKLTSAPVDKTFELVIITGRGHTYSLQPWVDVFFAYAQDALEFVGWELIGVISQAIADDFESDALEERKKILQLIAEVSKLSYFSQSGVIGFLFSFCFYLMKQIGRFKTITNKQLWLICLHVIAEDW